MVELHLGKILRDARGPKTLRQLSDASGISNAYLCQLEMSPTRLLQISWVQLVRLVKAYGLDREKLEKKMTQAAKQAKILA